MIVLLRLHAAVLVLLCQTFGGVTKDRMCDIFTRIERTNKMHGHLLAADQLDILLQHKVISPLYLICQAAGMVTLQFKD
jgi:hypothetical protein